MSDEVKQPIVKDEIRQVEYMDKEADRKFILAFSVIVIFAIMLIIPVLTSNEALLKDVAGLMSGLVGTIIGYYFGSKKEGS